MAKKKTKLKFDDEPLTDNPFAAAFGGAASTPEPATAPPSEVEDEVDFHSTTRVILRCVRAGRKGKTVTTVEGLVGTEAALDRAAGVLKRSLGCGAHVEGEAVVLQGDQRVRVEAWLVERGVSRVVRG